MVGSSRDTIRELGALALASRLRRLSDRLARDISRIYAENEIAFEARWFPVAHLLAQQSPMAVTEIAEALDFTHPAVNQIAGQMEKHGLVLSSRDRSDERKRLLSLSAAGRKTVKSLQPLWEIIRQCNEELLSSIDRDLLNTLDRVENALAEKEMYDRVAERLHPELSAEVRIEPFDSRLEKHFKKLNVEWLKEYFSVEPSDQRTLNHPREVILDRGGRILFARVEDAVVGTVALVNHGGGVYELAKMAVTKRFRNRGIGKRLAESCLLEAHNLEATEIVLATSPVLAAANALYRKLGFRKVSAVPSWAPDYARDTIYMRLKLTDRK